MAKQEDTLFISIGENCLTHGVLKRHSTALLASPFSHARSNVDYLIQMVESDFDGFLDVKKISHAERLGKIVPVHNVYSSSSTIFHPTVCNSFEFSHHDVLNSVSAMTSYERKTERFIAALKGDRPVCLVYHYRHHPSQNIHEVAGKLAELKALCMPLGSRPLTIAMFTQRIVARDSNRRIQFNRVHGVPVATLFTRTAWGSDDMETFWGLADDDLFGQMIGAFKYVSMTARKPPSPVRKSRFAWAIGMLSKRIPKSWRSNA